MALCDADTYLDTAEAAAFLGERGVRTAPQTLRKLRSTGGGPTFFKPSLRCVYRRRDLVSWAAAKLGPPRLSTSDMPRRQEL